MNGNKRKYWVWGITICFVLLWVGFSVTPTSKPDWLAESSVLLLAVPFFILIGEVWRISLLSYVLFGIFLLFHLIGAHYGYGSASPGVLLSELVHIKGNHYDKMVHFLFGFLLAYPLWEIVKKEVTFKHSWMIIPIVVFLILGFSAFYEIWEWLTALRLDPVVAYLYIGGTDVWDTQKDMLVAGIGALLSMTGVYFWNWRE